MSIRQPTDSNLASLESSPSTEPRPSDRSDRLSKVRSREDVGHASRVKPAALFIFCETSNSLEENYSLLHRAYRHLLTSRVQPAA